MTQEKPTTQYFADHLTRWMQNIVGWAFLSSVYLWLDIACIGISCMFLW